MIRVKVPGSLMLMGEHAVLQGELALALAVDSFVEVCLTPRSDRRVIIDSALAKYDASLDQLESNARLSFVLTAIQAYQAKLDFGFDLQISSEFSHQVGLGSSAAVTAGVIAAMSQLCHEQLTPEQLFERSLAVVHTVQGGRGSGTDLVASIFGGIVAYRVSPREIRRLDASPAIDLYYVGYKLATPEVISRVEAMAKSAPDFYRQLYRLMGQTTEAAERAIKQHDWPLLGQLMNSYAGLLDALGVCDINLADLQYRLRACEQVLGAKISGSGLGDSVIVLGRAESLGLDYLHIPVSISPQGLQIFGDAHE